MKTLKTVILSLFVVVFVFATNAGTSSSTKVESEKTKVYYFHNTRRCMTCNAIEKVTKSTLEKTFASEMKNGELKFETLNAEEKENKELCEKLGVSGSALIVMHGDEKTDLTSKGFMYALNQPEKLEQALIKAIEK